MVLGLVGSVIAGVTVRAVVSGDLGMFAGELRELAISSEAPRDDRAPARGAREEGDDGVLHAMRSQGHGWS